MCDYTVAVVSQKDHLVLPVVTAKRPAMGKCDNFSIGVAPVLIEELGPISELQVGHIGYFRCGMKVLLLVLTNRKWNFPFTDESRNINMLEQ